MYGLYSRSGIDDSPECEDLPDPAQEIQDPLLHWSAMMGLTSIQFKCLLDDAGNYDRVSSSGSFLQIHLTLASFAPRRRVCIIFVSSAIPLPAISNAVP